MSKDSDTPVAMNIRVPAVLHTKLERLAFEMRAPVSFAVRTLLYEAIEARENDGRKTAKK